MTKALLVTSALAVALTAGVVPSHAAAPQRPSRDLQAIASVGSDSGTATSLLACRERRAGGQAWRVHLRVDNRQGDGPARARYAVQRQRSVVARWSSGRVRAGKVTRVATIRVPARRGLQQRLTLETPNGAAAGAGSFDVPRC